MPDPEDEFSFSGDEAAADTAGWEDDDADWADLDDPTPSKPGAAAPSTAAGVQQNAGPIPFRPAAPQASQPATQAPATSAAAPPKQPPAAAPAASAKAPPQTVAAGAQPLKAASGTPSDAATTTPPATAAPGQPAAVPADSGAAAAAAAPPPTAAAGPGAPNAATAAAAAAAPSPHITPLPSEIQAASESPSPDPTARPPAAAAAAAGSSSAAGWGGGWGLGALGGLGNRLQQVALGAVKDIKEITETLQQAMAEVQAPDDEVEQLSAYQAPHKSTAALSAAADQPPTAGPPAAAAAGAGAGQQQVPPPPPAAAAAGGGGAVDQPPGEVGINREVVHVTEGVAVGPSGLDPAEAARRRAVLARLEGQPTSQLELGLKAIDTQVEVLTAGAAKALGSLWGGLGAVAQRVEAARVTLAKELGGLERKLEEVSRGLLSPLAATLGPAGAAEQLSFGEGFSLYGGGAAAEELEQLACECARVCNRVRARLKGGAEGQHVDQLLSGMAPQFDLDQTLPPAAAGDPEQAATAATLDELLHLYAPVAGLCSKGKHKAAKLQLQLQEASVTPGSTRPSAPGDVQLPAAGDAPPAAAAAAAVAGGAEGQDAPSGLPTEEEFSEAAEQHGMLEHLVEELHKSAVVSLCEVSAGQVMLLLQLAESLTAASKGVSPAGHQPVTWPDSGLAAAAALRQLTESMLKDVDEVLAAYDAAAADVLVSAQQLEGRLQAMRESLRASVAGEAAAAAAAAAAGGAGAAEKQASGHEEQQQEQQQGAEGQPGAGAAASEGGRPLEPGGSRSGSGPGSSSGGGGSSGAAADAAAAAPPLKPRTTRAVAEAQALPGVLSEAHGAAVRVLRDGFRGLLYVVLLSSIHKAGLRAAPPAAAAEEGAAQAAAAGDGSGGGAPDAAAAAAATAAAGPETGDAPPPVDGDGSATPAAVAAAEGVGRVEGGKEN